MPGESKRTSIRAFPSWSWAEIATGAAYFAVSPGAGDGFFASAGASVTGAELLAAAGSLGFEGEVQQASIEEATTTVATAWARRFMEGSILS